VVVKKKIKFYLFYPFPLPFSRLLRVKAFWFFLLIYDIIETMLKKYTFRVNMLVILFITIVISIVPIGLFSYLNLKNTATTLSNEVVDQATQRIEVKISSILNKAKTQGIFFKSLLDRRELAYEDFKNLTLYFYEALKANPELSYISFGSELRGEYCHAVRDRDHNLSIRYKLRNKDGNLDISDYVLENNKLKRINFIPNMKQNDPRGRPYYKQAKEAMHNTWTETYVFIGASGSLNIPGVTYAAPIYIDKKLIGVMTFDFDLFAISDFLSKLDLGMDSFSFIIESRKDSTLRVIGHPSPEILVADVIDESGNIHGKDTIEASKISDPLVNQFVKHIDPTHLEKGYIGSNILTFKSENKEYFGDYTSLRFDTGLNWITCTVIPKDSIYAVANKSLKLTLIIACGIFIISTIIAIYVSKLVSNPLEKISNATKKIGQFDLDSKERVYSRVIEIDQLGKSVEDMKSSLRSFKKYVPSELVKRLLSSGKEAKLGGSRKNLTVYFSDIKNFMTISEKLKPEELVKTLSDYLGEMSTNIQNFSGTVDKYIGDAIMAFWGAPIHQSEHALLACRAALTNNDALVELHKKWKSEDKICFEARIGINTGEMIVGNIGSHARFDYTVIGDAVNLASRLEMLNKYYKTKIIISESTYSLVKDNLICRPLDKVSVKGKENNIIIYELLAEEGKSDKHLDDIVLHTTEGFHSYLRQDWKKSYMHYTESLKLDSNDGISNIMIERINIYKNSCLPKNWNGIFEMETK